MTNYFVEKFRRYGRWVGNPDDPGSWFDETSMEVKKNDKPLVQKEFDTFEEAKSYYDSLTVSYGKTYVDEKRLAELNEHGEVVDWMYMKYATDKRGR